MTKSAAAPSTPTGRVEATEAGIRKELRERIVVRESEVTAMVERAVAAIDIKAEYEAAVVRCIKALVANEADSLARSQVQEMSDVLLRKIKGGP